VLTLAGCALAHTAWTQNLVLHFADGHRLSRGASGFDLDELPWTPGWRDEKAFFPAIIDAGASSAAACATRASSPSGDGG
jgi:hypothetical protein